MTLTSVFLHFILPFTLGLKSIVHIRFPNKKSSLSDDENANQESFHASLKKEWLYHKSFNTINDVKRAVFEYIEGFYNNKRIHFSLENLSPIQFEFQYFNRTPTSFVQSIDITPTQNKKTLSNDNVLITNGVLQRIRTFDPRLRRPLLYPAELAGQGLFKQ